MADDQITTSQLGKVANQGSTLRPVYGERRPMMYHLFESEMKSISHFNSLALASFTVCGFFVNTVIATVLGWGFATGQLTEFGAFMIHRGVYWLAVLGSIFFFFGIAAIWHRKSVTDLIKRETRLNDAPSR